MRQNKKLLLGMSIFDNLAWICYAGAATLIPIAIAVSISESYIALTAMLGILINKEKLMRHQKILQKNPSKARQPRTQSSVYSKVVTNTKVYKQKHNSKSYVSDQ